MPTGLSCAVQAAQHPNPEALTLLLRQLLLLLLLPLLRLLLLLLLQLPLLWPQHAGTCSTDRRYLKGDTPLGIGTHPRCCRQLRSMENAVSLGSIVQNRVVCLWVHPHRLQPDPHRQGSQPKPQQHPPPTQKLVRQLRPCTSSTRRRILRKASSSFCDFSEGRRHQMSRYRRRISA